MEGRIMEYAELLGSVDLFKNQRDAVTMAMFCNALEERFFVEGEEVVRQGEYADSFYIIFKGHCRVVVDGQEVSQLQRGDFFGDRALIQDDVRAATVQVTSEDATVLALDKIAFNLLLSPVDLSEHPDVANFNARGSVRESNEQFEKSYHLMNKLRQQFIKGRTMRASVQAVHEGRLDIPKEQLQRLGVLGRGAFGFVSLERDSLTGTCYALKAMSKGHIVQERLKDMVSNEKACMELLDSDFVVQLIRTYRDVQNIYLLLEPCFGGELFDFFDSYDDAFGSEIHCRFYAACVGLGLEHIHSRRVIYRDLKLENCLLTLTGYVKLTDMGIAKVCVGKTYTVCGTTDYFAPETLRQTGHNRAVDWWALGVMCFIMMTGRSPFDAPDTMKIYRKIMKGFAKVSFPTDFSEQCKAMMLALCQKNPEERLTMGALGIQNFKDHPWYREFHWHALEMLQMTAPHIPPITEDDCIQKAMNSTLQEEHGGIPYYDDGSGWDDIFDKP